MHVGCFQLVKKSIISDILTSNSDASSQCRLIYKCRINIDKQKEGPILFDQKKRRDKTLVNLYVCDLQWLAKN